MVYNIVENEYVTFWIENVQHHQHENEASPSTSKKKWKWFENSASVIVNIFTMINYNYVDNKTAFDNMSQFLIFVLNVLFVL